MLWVGQNSLEVVAINHAARKVGAVCVPMNYRLAPDEAQYVIDNCDAVVVLFDIEQVDQLELDPRRRATVCAPGTASAATAASSPPGPQDFDALDRRRRRPTSPTRVGEDETAGTTMIYTSGTTGKPKGTVRRTEAEQVRGRLRGDGRLGPRRRVPHDRAAVSLGSARLHAAGAGLGGSVVVQRHFDAEDWLRARREAQGHHDVLARRRRSAASSTCPTRSVSKYDASSMQRLIANAAPWPFELKKKYVERVNDYSLFEVYGSTELGVNTMLLPADQMRKPGSCGRPIPGVDDQVVRRRRQRSDRADGSPASCSC